MKTLMYVSLLEDVVGPKPHPQELDLPHPKAKAPVAERPIPNGSLVAFKDPPPPKRPERYTFHSKPIRPTWSWGGGEDGPPPGFHATQPKPYEIKENYSDFIRGVVDKLLLAEWNASPLADKFMYDPDALERHEDKAASTLEKEKGSNTPKSMAKKNAANFVLDAAGHIQDTYDEYSGHERQHEAPELGADDISSEYDKRVPNKVNGVK